MQPSPLINSSFQALPLGPITAPAAKRHRLPTFKRPVGLPRTGQRDVLRFLRKATEMKLSAAGVGNRERRRAYVRKLKFA